MVLQKSGVIKSSKKVKNSAGTSKNCDRVIKHVHFHVDKSKMSKNSSVKNVDTQTPKHGPNIKFTNSYFQTRPSNQFSLEKLHDTFYQKFRNAGYLIFRILSENSDEAKTTLRESVGDKFTKDQFLNRYKQRHTFEFALWHAFSDNYAHAVLNATVDLFLIRFFKKKE